MTYRALMLSGVPNFVFTVGYTNASWTLKVDLVAEYACRLLDAHGRARLPHASYPGATPTVGEVAVDGLHLGLRVRALDQLPHQGDREPWRLRQSYLRDRRTIRRAAARRRRPDVLLSLAVTRRMRVPAGARVRDAGVRERHETEGAHMGLDDKVENKATEAKGKAKEAAGRRPATRAWSPRARRDQGEAKVKEAGEHVKEAAGERQGHLQQLSRSHGAASSARRCLARREDPAAPPGRGSAGCARGA